MIYRNGNKEQADEKGSLGYNIGKPDHGQVRLQSYTVFEAANKNEIMSSRLIPHLSKELVDVV